MNGSAKHSEQMAGKAPSIKHQPRGVRCYFGFGIGSVCLTGTETGGAYCLLEVSLAAGLRVPRHTHTREDETFHILSGELEVIVGDEVFVLRAGDTLVAPRGIPHELSNGGDAENRYLQIFSPPGLEEFLLVTAVSAPDRAIAPDQPPSASSIRQLAADFGIHFD